MRQKFQPEPFDPNQPIGDGDVLDDSRAEKKRNLSYVPPEKRERLPGKEEEQSPEREQRLPGKEEQLRK